MNLANTLRKDAMICKDDAIGTGCNAVFFKETVVELVDNDVFFKEIVIRPIPYDKFCKEIVIERLTYDIFSGEHVIGKSVFCYLLPVFNTPFYPIIYLIKEINSHLKTNE